MHHLALQYIKSMPDNDQLTDIKYECLSSLGDWSEFVDTRDLEQKIAYSNHNVQSVLKAYCYSCLKDCLNIQMKPAFRNKLMQSLNGAKLALPFKGHKSVAASICRTLLHNQRIQMSQRVLATVKRQQCTDDAIFLESKNILGQRAERYRVVLLRDVVSRPASCQSFDIKLLGVSLRQYGL
ncbi:hypothetical protein ACJJTC_012464 [Scirpophaga incertulas]